MQNSIQRMDLVTLRAYKQDILMMDTWLMEMKRQQFGDGTGFSVTRKKSEDEEISTISQM